MLGFGGLLSLQFFVVSIAAILLLYGAALATYSLSPALSWTLVWLSAVSLYTLAGVVLGIVGGYIFAVIGVFATGNA